MTQVARRSTRTLQTASPRRLSRLPRVRTSHVLFALILLGVLGLLALRPIVGWTYHLNRAGMLMASGLVWPEPRRSDSLPLLRDDRKARQALAHLAAASRWRPNHPYSFRLTGQVYAAQANWERAAESFERARALQPGNPLLLWESSLAYEQMYRVLRTASTETLLPDLLSEPVEAPSQPIDTPFCRDDQPQTCYVGFDKWTQPVAGGDERVKVEADVLFMHPPASVTHIHSIPSAHPVLQFLLGLDPDTLAASSDGATFEVWASSTSQAPEQVYTRTLDTATARRGWVHGTADLSRWAGQDVTLTLRTTGGPAGNTVDDWYGWGNIALTTADAARAGAVAPRERMVAAWAELGLNGAALLARGEQARYFGRSDEALTWYARAAEASPVWADPWYYAALSYKSRQLWDKALDALTEAEHRAPDLRETWFEMGQAYAGRWEWDRAVQAYDRAVSLAGTRVGVSDILFWRGHTRQVYLGDSEGAAADYRQALDLDDYVAGGSVKADTYAWSGELLTARQRWAEAAEHFRKAATLFPADFRFPTWLAQSLFHLREYTAAETSGREAVKLNPGDKAPYQILAQIYRATGNIAEARAMYTRITEIDPHDTAALQALEELDGTAK